MKKYIARRPWASDRER